MKDFYQWNIFERAFCLGSPFSFIEGLLLSLSVYLPACLSFSLFLASQIFTCFVASWSVFYHSPASVLVSCKSVLDDNFQATTWVTLSLVESLLVIKKHR